MNNRIKALIVMMSGFFMSFIASIMLIGAIIGKIKPLVFVAVSLYFLAFVITITGFTLFAKGMTKK